MGRTLCPRIGEASSDDLGPQRGPWVPAACQREAEGRGPFLSLPPTPAAVFL
jgi:hypothetical protein